MRAKIALVIWLIGCVWFLTEAFLEKKGLHKWNWRNKVSYIPVFVGGILYFLFLYVW